MDYLSRFHFRCNYLYGFLIKRRSTTSNLDVNNSMLKENLDNKIEIHIDTNTINKLEKLSLVAFNNKEGIRKLEAAIRFAQKLKNLQVDNSIKPMYSVLENEKLKLRDDNVFEGNCRNEILKNTKIIEDDYFIAPCDSRSKNY